jgi:hypothetical protein
MKKISVIGIVLIILFVVLAFLFGLLFSKLVLTGQTVSDRGGDSYIPDQTLTKAVCNGNGCVDVKISCKNGSVVNLELVSENIVEFESGWKDSRDPSKGLCS